MRYISTFLLSLVVLTVQTAFSQSKVFDINTDNTSLIYTVGEDGRLIFRYYGDKIHDAADFAKIKGYNIASTKRIMNYEAYPSYGLGYANEPAFSAINPDGSMISEFKFVDVGSFDSDDVLHKVFKLKDSVSGLIIELHTEAYPEEDVIKQWTVFRNEGKESFLLKNMYSSFLNIKANEYYLTHFHGAWASEMKMVEEKLTFGIKTIESKKGVRTTQTENPSFILSLDMPANETAGKCIGGALAWSGNYKLSFELDERNRLNILSGINPFMSEYKLKAKESLETPQMIYTYSSEGQGQLSRNFHDWARKYNMHNGYVEHPIVLNNWEGTYFDFNEEVLTRMMDDAAAFGVEMFVLDDGWFGNKYPRNSDKLGLGDWQVNKEKLPHGIQYLVDYATGKGLKFGIWIEPEMVSPQSELAEKHPDWIVQSPGREKILIRNQLLLDLTNPKVRDFIWNMIDKLLTENPGIAYIKWDANRHVEQAGSEYLPDDEQQHFWINYTKGLYSIYEKIREKYPDLMLQACASGGGRVDYGALKYHDEFWTSDNTDALQRVYMQYATNLIYPAVATAAHVSSVPCHQTGVVIPVKFRFDVAMSGRMGLELQPKRIPENEVEFVKNAIEFYKKDVRELVTHGDLYRLISPYKCSDNYAANAYIRKDKSKAVLFVYCTGHNRRNILPAVRLQGLAPEKTYKITEINKNKKKSVFWGDRQTFTGEYLMNMGIELQLAKQFESAVFILEEVR